MTTLVVADAHLKVTQDHRGEIDAFAAFLRTIDPAVYPRLLILGDLFDFWFEYRHVIFSGYFDVLRALADLRDAGVELHLVCGNHDFWAGRFLRDELGMQIHPDGIHLEDGGQRAFFVHGDGVNPDDKGYLYYKRVARSSWAIALFQLIHPDLAMGIAQAVSHGSRRYFSPEHPAQSSDAKAIREFAQRMLIRGDADAVVCGHTHHPERMEVPVAGGEGWYINTGAWLDARACLIWREGAFEHVTYDAGAGFVPLEPQITKP